MKNLLTILPLLLCLGTAALAQINPSYKSFNTNDFYTNATPWPIAVQSNLTVNQLVVLSNAYFGNVVTISNNATFLSNVNVAVNLFISNSLYVASNMFVTNNLYVTGTNFATFIGDGNQITNLPSHTWLPNLAYESWYDPMSSINGTCIGTLCWVNGSGGGTSVLCSNAVSHFGTVAATTGATSNSTVHLYLSSTATDKPVLPRMDQETGWTNTIVWRLNGTNDCKMYIALASGNITALPLTNAIGIAHITATNNQIMGYTSQDSANLSFTNLGTMVSSQWNTNEIWSTTAGTILFRLNGGAPAALTTTLPTTALTPRWGAYKTAGTAAVSLEVDIWKLHKLR